MLKDTTVVRFRQPDAIDDPLTELAREGARRMLAQALVAEADAFVALWKDLKLPDGRDRVVRHGHGPHRAIQTGVGPVEVRRAKVRDRGEVSAEEKIRFTSSICRSGRGSELPGGACTHWKAPPCHGAPPMRSLPDANVGTIGKPSLAPPHSMTSSVRASSDRGTFSPSAFAVSRLTIKSKLVGCSTGKSDGFSPLTILST